MFFCQCGQNYQRVMKVGYNIRKSESSILWVLQEHWQACQLFKFSV
jgi:hypothetical protein